MKTFNCCCSADALLFFESTSCTVCGRMVGFCADRDALLAFDWDETADSWSSAVAPDAHYRQCLNYSDHQVCNWMVAADDAQPFCRACRCNEVIPDLSVPENIFYWRKLEAAKRHALYTLLKLRLPFGSKHEAVSSNSDSALNKNDNVGSKNDGAGSGLLFRFMSDKDVYSEFTQPLEGLTPVYTGHERGEITINLAEADDIARTRARIKLGEGYRTLLGHFRHELGHYYWNVLLESKPRLLKEFRALFGDEREDYAAALQNYYAAGAVADWPANYLSAYASMHPWEDWAECWAHYMHMIDTLETAETFSLSLYAERIDSGFAALATDSRPLDGDNLLKNWMRLAVAMNALNRSMGLEDAYPFVLTDTIRAKLSWIHRVIGAHAKRKPRNLA